MIDLILAQTLNGLASASSLFLVASGLSIIFGVTRIVNFAHGSLYMLGAYLAWTLVNHFGPADPLGFWGGVGLAALAVGLLGVAVEVLVLRRIYRAPELFQLLATFGVVLMVQDLALAIWGPEDKLGPRAPGFRSFVVLFGNRFPTYELFLIVVGPAVLGLIWFLFRKTRWGTLVRAATQDREMLGALGVNQRLLFTSVFCFGATLAGLGGALQLPREAVNLHMDLSMITEAFVVVVVGGLGSVTGAYLHLMMGPGGMASFGHAAYFGLGAYGAALAVRWIGAPMEPALVLAPFLAGLAGVVFGWFCVRLSGVHLAMLTLAFAQIAWATAFQWVELTGGDNGLLGIWPSAWAAPKIAYYYLV